MRRVALYGLGILALVTSACGDGGGEATSTATVVISDRPTATISLAAPAPTASNTAPPAGTSPPDIPSMTPTGAQPTATVAATAPAVVEIPETPVGERLEAMLDAINQGGQGLTTEVVQEVFSDSVLSEMPAAQLGQALRAFATGDAPLTLTGFYTPPTPTQAVAIVTTRGGTELLLTVAVEQQAPHRMTVFFAQPAPVATVVNSWDEFLEQASALAPAVGVTIAEITSAECAPLALLDADRQLAIGSAFKLYVLGELARQVEEGIAHWDDEIPVQEELKSLPSGTLQDVPAGTMVTVRRLAELMISISDNTATDHLIHHLGRQNVTGMLATMGHSEPTLNDPFLTTREMFVLKLMMDDARVAAFISATTDERLAILETEVAGAELSLSDAASWTRPRFIGEIEWFASATDLCAALRWLGEASSRNGLEPLRDILSINPGIPIDAAAWNWVGFKGGSEPGVLNLSWQLERADGRVFVVTASFNDDTALIDETAVIHLMMGAIDALATEP